MNISRRRHILGEHPKGAKKPQRKNGKWNVPWEIQDEYHKLMASPGTPQPDLSSDPIASILDQALTWHYENRAKRTADRYKDFCQDLIDKYGTLSAAELTIAHITQWLFEKTTWNPTTNTTRLTDTQKT